MKGNYHVRVSRYRHFSVPRWKFFASMILFLIQIFAILALLIVDVEPKWILLTVLSIPLNFIIFFVDWGKFK